ncbi:MAG: hypothetical protein INR71_00225 [Terriglobus roseus]|nr:hypothetical protein [Terriglobus roseus]
MVAEDAGAGKNGDGSTPKRPRAMSQTSTDREASNGLSPPQHDSSAGDSSLGSRKRQATDSLDYPRRRATIAVSHILFHICL